MIDFIVNLISLFASFLDALLPDSPFAGLIETLRLMHTGLGWLNWMCPINQMLALFAAWLTACIAAVVARILWLKAQGAIGILTGNGKVVM